MPNVYYGTVRRFEASLDRSGLRRGAPRPMLRVRLIGAQVGPELLALVDSGADRSLFHADQASLAGIDLAPGQPHMVRGVGGTVTVRTCRVGVEIEGLRFEIDANFTDDPAQRTLALLGREGVFTRFQLGFDRRAGLLLIEPYP